MGVARKSMLINDHEKRVTAYHEAGHALVAVMTEGADPLHKVTIIPRGMALGVTQQLPVDDRHTYPKTYLEGQLAIMMGGRLAEELFLDTMTTGAGNDIEQATELARKMVCQFGMSSLGPLTFGKQEEQIFLGREIAQHRDYSESTALAIDDEVRKFVISGYERAKAILNENREALIRIAEALLERESLDAAEIKLLIAGQPLEERRARQGRTETEKPTPAPAKGVYGQRRASRRTESPHRPKGSIRARPRPSVTHHGWPLLLCAPCDRSHWTFLEQRLRSGTRTAVMGILNVTPDSFSDGGQYFDRDKASRVASEIEEEGADILDIGGESSRPGKRSGSGRGRNPACAARH